MQVTVRTIISVYSAQANTVLRNVPTEMKTPKKCHNCGGNHTANYGGCIKMQLEKKVQYIKA